MRKKREFLDGSFYHVTSRTNDKIRVFENRLGRKIMLITLQDAKDKFGFRLTNFCIMPTHIHLLIQPVTGTNLSEIMQWLKTRTAKRWNFIHGSRDHLWGNRYFARIVKDPEDYSSVMNYIDQNPVKAELAATPAEWKASGAFYKANNVNGLVDFIQNDRQSYIKLLSSLPFSVSRLLPPAQLEHILKYIGVYTEEISRLNTLIPTIPKISATAATQDPPFYLHYFTDTADYYIYEYDGDDTFFGKVRFNVYPAETHYQKFSLVNLKSNQFLELAVSGTG